MKKIFGIIAIALLFSFAGTQEVIAQDNWEIKVTWEDGCDPCQEITGHQYVVCLKIWDKCTETVAYAENCVIKSSGAIDHTFEIGDICVPGIQQCFEVTASVKKRCVSSQEIICQNAKMELHSCNDIYYGFELACNIP